MFPEDEKKKKRINNVYVKVATITGQRSIFHELSVRNLIILTLSTNLQNITKILSNHWFFGVFVKWIPSYTHHHFVHWSSVNTCPAIVNASINSLRKTIHYICWKVCWKIKTNNSPLHTKCKSRRWLKQLYRQHISATFHPQLLEINVARFNSTYQHEQLVVQQYFFVSGCNIFCA